MVATSGFGFTIRGTTTLPARFGATPLVPVTVMLNVCGRVRIGTVTLAGSEGAEPGAVTMSWNVRLVGPPTAGARNVKVGVLIVLPKGITTGLPGLMIWVQAKAPFGGVLAVPSSVTEVPGNGGLGVEVNVGRATEAKVPAVQVSGGAVISGHGLSCVV